MVYSRFFDNHIHICLEIYLVKICKIKCVSKCLRGLQDANAGLANPMQSMLGTWPSFLDLWTNNSRSAGLSKIVHEDFYGATY